MSGNISGNWGEMSFFGDGLFNIGENNKNNKELSKNSSNPEKIYDKLNSEIKKVTENGKDLSYQSSNSNSKILERPQINENLFDSKYWKTNNKEIKINEENPIQFTNKYEKLKNKNSQKKKLKNKIPLPISVSKKENQIFEQYSDTDDFDSDELNENSNENNEIIHKVSSIQIQQNNLNYNNSTVDSSTINKNNRVICMTEPDEYSFNQISNINNLNIHQQEIFRNQLMRFAPMGSFVSMNYPTLGKGSFISNYQNNNNNINKNWNEINKEMFINNDNKVLDDNNERDIETNEGIENSNIVNLQNYCNTEYKARIPDSELYDSKFSNFPIMNLNMVYCSQIPSSNIIKEPNNQNNNNNNNNNNCLNINEIENKKANSKSTEKLKNNNTVNTTLNKVNGNLNKINNNNTFHNGNKSNVKNHNSKTDSLKGEKHLLKLDNIINGKDTRTTVMIRNIPIKYTDKMLIEELEEFKGKFDCIYMPYDYEKRGNKGYAFINLTHPYHILLFHEKFQNKTWTYFESKKICELNSANFQGINDIQKHAKNYKGLKKPIFFNDNDNSKKLIEVPLKYLKKVKIRYPKMVYTEKKNFDIFIIKSFEE